MRVTLLKIGKIPVPPTLYGGTERVVYWLGKALIELGHQVTLVAPTGSVLPGADVRLVSSEGRDHAAWLKQVPDNTDIVHSFDFIRETPKAPMLFTCEGNGQPGEVFPPNTVFVSQRHAANHNSRHFVYNGIDLGEYECSATRENYAVYLAKARWSVKNFSGAVAVARRAGVELRVLGSRNWPLNMQRWLPAIRGVKYYGMLGGPEKRALLAKARCLIFPVRWEEPFGIALTEALASGAYVAGTPYGSLPEVVTPAAGRLSARAADLVEAVKTPQRFDPQVCRARVQSGGLTHLDMARKYLACYERILSHGSLLENGESAPATKAGFKAKELLPWQE